MFKSTKEQDGYKNTQTHYYLTQGDSCSIVATPHKNGVDVTNNVSMCLFKLGTSSNKQVDLAELDSKGEIIKDDKGNPQYIFPITMEKNTSGSGFVLNLSSKITSRLTAGSYNYEIEYTMTDGSVQTPNAWKFDIVPEIQSLPIKK